MGYFISSAKAMKLNVHKQMGAEYHEHNKITPKKVKIANPLLKYLVCRWLQLVFKANSFFFAPLILVTDGDGI